MGKQQSGQQGPETVRQQEQQEDQLVGPQGDLSPSPQQQEEQGRQDAGQDRNPEKRDQQR